MVNDSILMDFSKAYKGLPHDLLLAKRQVTVVVKIV